MEPQKIYYEKIGVKLISEFKKRNIDSRYFKNSTELLEYLKTLIPENSVVSWGGSMTLKETGTADFLKSGKFNTLDRDNASGAEEIKKIFHEALSADYYFMSSNAVTKDGKLVNTDATGNRVAALCYGPENVIVIAGMNKVVTDEAAAIDRIRNYASPINTIRISRDTPCSKTGKCGHCLGSQSICSHTVITRNSVFEGRIKVLLIGEEYGF